ncbi:MAG TPA: polysaccharide deacetylase family protein [Longimicrobiales bacterium]
MNVTVGRTANHAVLVLSLVTHVHCGVPEADDQGSLGSGREVAVTFDDVPGVHLPARGCHYTELAQLNQTLLEVLARHRVPATGLVVESNLCNGDDASLGDLLTMWLDAGMELGNHSFSHPDLNTVSPDVYNADILRGAASTQRVLQERGKTLKYFRHPYLHTGRDRRTKAAVDAFLAEHGYQVAPVTIDNQEWVFAAVYARALSRQDHVTMQRVGDAYLVYMEEMFAFFEDLSVEVLGYEVRQVLLLHANPLNAAYIDALVRMMKRRGYHFVSLDRALEDPAYQLADSYAGPRGLSWLHRWAFSKGMPITEEPREPSWIRQLFETP